MKFIERMRALLRPLATALGAAGLSGAGTPAAAQQASPDAILGIRIGQPLESQMAECPKNEKGEYGFGFHKGDTPCWAQDGSSREVRLPFKLLQDTRIHFDSRARVRVRDGVVVEIDIEAMGDQWRQVERYMMQNYGKPQESETYERDSRVGGVSKIRTHTWRGNGVTLYFDQRASSDQTRILAYSESWRALEAKERAEREKSR